MRSRKSTRRSLTAVEAILLLAIVAAVLLAGMHALKGPSVSTAGETVLVRVQPADTLWSIAVRHTPEGVDTVSTIETIRQLNGLETSAIASGQLLTVPDVRNGEELSASR